LITQFGYASTAVTFSKVNNTPPVADLDLYRESLRHRLAALIERMDSHSLALARLVLGMEHAEKPETEKPTDETDAA